MGNILSEVFETNYYTISLWYNHRVAESGGYRGLIGKWQNCCPNTGNNAFWGTAASFCSNTRCSQEISLPPIGNWVHWLVIMNSGNMKMYQNGILVTEEDNHYSLASDMPLQVSNWANYSFQGKIDDIRIFNKALSDGEVQLLYHEGGYGL